MLTPLYRFAVPVLLAGFAALAPDRAAPAAESAPAVFHPHFPKKLECRISRDVTLTLGYQTVTFDSDGANAMKPGQAWHLAGATFATSADVVVGGREVEAGQYALTARKVEDQEWELVLHQGRGFSTKIGDDAHVLDTEFVDDAPRLEHMNIDIQPAGDKEHTRLHLEVRFDRLIARATIEIPD